MIADVFVDTNVLVYALDAAQTTKQERAAAWMTTIWQTRRGRLSMQVLQEFYVTVTQKLSPGLDRIAARQEVRSLTAWRPIPVGPAIIEAAWNLQDRFALSWWDSLIVSAAQTAGCRYLLTEDLKDDQDLGGVVVVNPFTHAVDSLPRWTT